MKDFVLRSQQMYPPMSCHRLKTLMFKAKLSRTAFLKTEKYVESLSSWQTFLKDSVCLCLPYCVVLFSEWVPSASQ